MTGYHAAQKQHVVKFWKWILETSDDQNPINDDDGSRHDLSTDLVYLVGNFGGTSNRKLPPISSKQSLFVPVNTVAISEPEADPDTRLEVIAEKDALSASQAEFQIDDGKKQNVLDAKYRVVTGRFPVDLPTGSCKGAADGYCIIIDPLPPGPHKISFEAKVKEPYKQGQPPWESKVTYTFDVQEK